LDEKCYFSSAVSVYRGGRSDRKKRGLTLPLLLSIFLLVGTPRRVEFSLLTVEVQHGFVEVLTVLVVFDDVGDATPRTPSAPVSHPDRQSGDSVHLHLGDVCPASVQPFLHHRGEFVEVHGDGVTVGGVVFQSDPPVDFNLFCFVVLVPSSHILQGDVVGVIVVVGHLVSFGGLLL